MPLKFSANEQNKNPFWILHCVIDSKPRQLGAILCSILLAVGVHIDEHRFISTGAVVLCYWCCRTEVIQACCWYSDGFLHATHNNKQLPLVTISIMNFSYLFLSSASNTQYKRYPRDTIWFFFKNGVLCCTMSPYRCNPLSQSHVSLKPSGAQKKKPENMK